MLVLIWHLSARLPIFKQQAFGSLSSQHLQEMLRHWGCNISKKRLWSSSPVHRVIFHTFKQNSPVSSEECVDAPLHSAAASYFSGSATSCKDFHSSHYRQVPSSVTLTQKAQEGLKLGETGLGIGSPRPDHETPPTLYASDRGNSTSVEQSMHQPALQETDGDRQNTNASPRAASRVRAILVEIGCNQIMHGLELCPDTHRRQSVMLLPPW